MRFFSGARSDAAIRPKDPHLPDVVTARRNLDALLDLGNCRKVEMTRERLKQWYSTTLLSRLDNKEQDASPRRRRTARPVVTGSSAFRG